MKVSSSIKLLLIFAAVALTFRAGFAYFTAETVTFTVQEKQVVTDQGSSRYLVFTGGEVFENTDCFTRFKFDSSDLQSELKEGETYTATVYGWRVPLFSWYRNIVSIH